MDTLDSCFLAWLAVVKVPAGVVILGQEMTVPNEVQWQCIDELKTITYLVQLVAQPALELECAVLEH
jgi:hypothetical protein